MAKPPVSTGTMSSKAGHGMAKAGNPCGSWPRTATPARAERSSAATAKVAPTTAMRMPGTRLMRLSARMTASVPAPTASAIQLVLPAATAWRNPHARCGRPSPGTEKPKSLGSCPTSTVSAMPFM